MTTFITRKDITREKKIIGSELAALQQLVYDDFNFQCYRDNGEEHLYWEMFDHFQVRILSYDSYHKYLGLNHTDVNTFTSVLAVKLAELFQSIDVSEFYVISHLKLDFFGNRDNKFRPLVKAYRKLEKIVGRNTYTEAFGISLKELPEFIDILFWINRCDPSTAEFICLFDKDEKIEIHLCKYGNIYLTEFGQERLSYDILNSLGWESKERSDHGNFLTDGSIEGRISKL